MRLLVILNGSNLRRWNPDLPEALARVAREEDHPLRIEISKSPAHMDLLVGAGIEEGVDAVLSAGGDGTLHYLVNHPLAPRVAVSMLPAGTINAFLRSEGIDVRRPLHAFRQLLRGRMVDGHVGMVNGRRFACFASWGFDARVVHTNPSDWKRRWGAASYLATGVRGILHARRDAFAGRLRLDSCPGPPIGATSVIVSKIRNYAGLDSFRVTPRDPGFEGLAVPSDHPARLLSLFASIGLSAATARRFRTWPGTRVLPEFRRLAWRSAVPVYLQLDGEAVVVEGGESLDLRADPVGQRFLLPD